MTTTTTLNIRLTSRQKLYNRFDPIYRFLDQIVFRGLFQPPKRSVKGAFEQITAADMDFLVENLNKHRLVLWLNVILAAYLAFSGLAAILKFGDPSTVVTGLLAPAMITGGAWYAVSFGGIPEKFISSAFVLTFCMFLAFTLSITLLVALLFKLTPWPVGVFFLLPIYAGLYLASILYDNLDGLKIGLDTALLKFSRASLNFYQKHGLVVREDAELDRFEDQAKAPTSEEIALFNHYMKMLENNIAQLDRERTLQVANHLIAASTDILFSIVNLSLPSGRHIDRGPEFAEYVDDAFDKDQAPVDDATVRYLDLAIEALKFTIGPESARELDSAKSDLRGFARLKARSRQPSSNTAAGTDQKMADHLFSQVFRKLLSLINAHKDILYQGFRRARSINNE